MDDRLAKVDISPFEGMDPAHPTPEWFQMNEQLVRRMGTFIEDIRTKAEDENVLVCTHVLPLMASLQCLTPSNPERWIGAYIENGSIFAADFRQRGGIVEQWV